MKQWLVSAHNKDNEKPDIEWLVAAEDEDQAADIGFKKANADPNASASSLGVDQYPLDTEGREDKEEIIWRLFDTLRMTREYMKLAELTYAETSKDTQHVQVFFKDGHSKIINVSLDSGIAMIRDVLRGLE